MPKSDVDPFSVADGLLIDDGEHKQRAIMESKEARNDCIDCNNVEFRVQKCELSSKASDRMPLQVSSFTIYKEES